MRKDIDTIFKTNRDERLIISGMTSKTLKPGAKEKAIKWLKDLVSEVLESIGQGSSSEIIFVAQGRSNNRDIQLAEVRLQQRGSTKTKERFCG
jgi:hypothetical protein